MREVMHMYLVNEFEHDTVDQLAGVINITYACSNHG